LTVRISIVGTGYVGLVSGVCLAHVGHEVVGVDLDEAKVAAINAGDCPIHEDGLADLLAGVVGTRFRATSDLRAAVADTEVTILAVGTPFGEERIDLSQIRTAAEQVGAALADVGRYHVVAVKSTVVPGTTEGVVGPALASASGRRIGQDIGLAMNPEFLREGVAVADFLDPDRIVLGGVDERTLDVLAEVYAPFDGVPVLRVDPSTAEMVKYSANALLATLISFSNEIANLSAAVGTDVDDVLDGVHLDRRLSPTVDGRRISPSILTFLRAGAGFGGSCFPKDVRALVAHGEDADVPMPLLQAVLAVNERQPQVLVDRVLHHLDPVGARIAVLGAAFKPGTDDVRSSAAFPVVAALRAAGAEVVVHDPIALDNFRAARPADGVAYTDDIGVALDGADTVVLTTAWPEYASLPELLRGRDVLVVDGRRMFDPDDLPRYDGIGYPSSGVAARTVSDPPAPHHGAPGATGPSPTG
jgi:UDPglucose 6-dehydrogenase